MRRVRCCCDSRTYISINCSPHGLLIPGRNVAKIAQGIAHVISTEGAVLHLPLIGVAVFCVHSIIVLHVPEGVGGIATATSLKEDN